MRSISSLCCRSISSRVISRVHFGQTFLIQDSSLPFSRASGPGPSSYRPTKGGRGHGVAGLPASQLPSIRYASDGRRWPAVTFDVSASRCVGEGSARRERKCSAENNRSGQHEFSDREHCHFLSDRSVAFAARCDGQTYTPIATLEQIRQVGRIFPSGLVGSQLLNQTVVKRFQLKQIFCDHESYHFILIIYVVPSAVRAKSLSLWEAPDLSRRLSIRIIPTDRSLPLNCQITYLGTRSGTCFGNRSPLAPIMIVSDPSALPVANLTHRSP
jgi:hypothetical protein